MNNPESNYLYRFFIPQDALEQVRRAAPDPLRSTAANISKVLEIMECELSQTENVRYSVDGHVYFQAFLQTIRAEYEKSLGLPEGSISASAIGSIVRGLGLSSVRRGNGYLVCWNSIQLNILKKYFQGK